MKRVFSERRWLIVLVIGLAVIPRVVELGVFRIVDEEHLWEWTEQFTRAVLARDWRGTAITAYPGLPFFWVQFINLALEMARRSLAQGGWIGDAGVYLVFHEWSREVFLAQRRLLLGFVNAALVIWLYLLVRRLFGERIGLVAGFLLALDPFLLSESRVARVEALSAAFVGLTVITLLFYFRQRRWRWLALSGILGGLAFSTKSQNLLLIGFVGVTIAGYWLFHGRSEGWKRSLRQMIPTGLFWLLMAVLAFALIWPAMWVDPRAAFRLIADYASTHATDPEFQELYFLGKTVVGQDPGPLFYVVVFLWRMTPWTLIGLVGALVWLVKGRQKDPPTWSRRAEVLVLLAFVVFYLAGMSLGAHKRTRYLLPVFPVLDVLAAGGLVWLGQVVARRWLADWSARRLAGVGIGGVLLVQSLVVLPHHPYYYDFYNPLLGGGPVAVKLIRVGWGEGMDQVAAYLNTRPNPDQLTVAARFGKYMVGFRGNIILLDTAWQWLHADYVVFYVQQVQKMLEPSPGVIRYFQRQTPEHVVRLGGIDYAWIYAKPVQYPANPRLSQISGKATLLGYSWQRVGDQMQVKVAWQNDGLQADEAMVMRLVSDTQSIEGNWQLCQTAPGSEMAARTAGEVAESLCSLHSGGTLPGILGLEFGVQESSGRLTPFDFPLARAALRFGDGGDIIPLTQSEMYDAAIAREVPPTAIQVRLNHGNRARLVGYEVEPKTLLPGEVLTVRLYWQALQPIDLDYHESVKLLDPANQPVGEVDQTLPLPTTRWWPGEVTNDIVVVPVNDDVSPPAILQLDVGLFYLETLRTLPVFNVDGQEIPRSLTRVKVLPPTWPDLKGVERLSYVFDESLILEGMHLAETTVTPGDTVSLELYWSSLNPVNEDYTVFIHLLDEAGNLVGQGDGPPVNGHYPTSAWSSGEVILDTHVIPISDEVASGRYDLVAGLYRVSDGTRLLAKPLQGEPTDTVVLGEIYVRE
jgi:4-amino-4-deoxy-L-arabinose transferase-like glycosyltransferase